MSLTTDEKSLLQRAICAGMMETQEPGVAPRITSNTLARVAAMTDEEVRAKLRYYKTTRAQQLTDHVNKLNLAMAETQTELDFVNSVSITPAE